MKQLFFPALAAVLLVAVIWNNRQVAQLKADLQAAQQQLAHAHEAAEPEEHYEVAVVMGRLQRHFEKLWFAGKAENWPLAGFYAHELEEGLEELAKAKVVDEGMEVSKLAGAMTAKPLEALEEAIGQEALPAFEGAYQRMLTTCNQCHQATGHAFIRLQLPERPPFSGQAFAK